jgi:hypothetical protein
LSEWIKNNQNIVIYTLLVIFTAVPLVNPIGLPITVSQSTIEFHDIIDTVNEGDIIWFDTAFGPGSWTENGPQSIIVWHHIIDRGGKVMFVSTVTDGPRMYERIIDQVNPEARGLEYGVDYVNIGFIAGLETAQAALATDTWSLVTEDVYGNKFENLPLMSEIRTGEDANIVICATSSGDRTVGWVAQLHEKFGTMILTLPISIGITSIQPYYESGQVSGILYGSRGAAEYEILTNRPGEAVTQTDALTMQHILLISVVIIGNLLYLNERRNQK